MTVNIRLATPNDLKLMQNCNLSCLPENYHYRYYMYHFASFPEVLYVAEDKPNHIVGYVLAKMEDDYDSMEKDGEKLVPNGHITSISIFRTYRKLGIATKLMNAAHGRLKDTLNAHYCSLHVRRSNLAAIHLYTNTFGYDIINIERGYYNDGEDALKLRLFFKDPPKKIKSPEFDDPRQRKIIRRGNIANTSPKKKNTGGGGGGGYRKGNKKKNKKKKKKKKGRRK